MGRCSGASLVRALLFASLFAGFAAHLAAGEKDCYDERDSVIRMCKWTIKKGSPYVTPDMPCRLEARAEEGGHALHLPRAHRRRRADHQPREARTLLPRSRRRPPRREQMRDLHHRGASATMRACVRSSDHGIVREEDEGRAGGDVRGE
ncbi:hypothetical protein ACQJBY_011631 [Aegilops geniculata]